LRKAQLTGLKQYFQLYRDRYGISHPEDPQRSLHEGPQPFNVITVRGDADLSDPTFNVFPADAKY
jgi:hypothetical protein